MLLLGVYNMLKFVVLDFSEKVTPCLRLDARHLPIIKICCKYQKESIQKIDNQEM